MEVQELCRNLPILETERLILRKITLDDLEDMFEYCSIDEVSRNVTWETHKSMADTKQFLEMILEQYENEKVVFWGIQWKENSRLIGTIDYVSWNPIHKIGEIGYVLSPDFWGKGIMTEAAKEVIKFGFEEMGLVRIQARCFLQNQGSERVMQKIGMALEGTVRKGIFAKGKHQDLKLYAIVNDNFQKRTTTP
ncbi:GNAT family N-acetyltransferase [Pseudalkalibacillus sp. SCS-8]|uniref:GNAT family N-acetyltransferase n=1 Tax=Pseudalkalibacillus nanhaiensis TaxID=3115291 RepID=UPI0032DA7F15